MKPAATIDEPWFGWRRRPASEIEARLYYPRFAPQARRAFSPPPDFSDLEAAGRDERRPIRSLVLSAMGHLFILVIAASSWGGDAPPKKSAQAPDGISVQLVDVIPTRSRSAVPALTAQNKLATQATSAPKPFSRTAMPIADVARTESPPAHADAPLSDRVLANDAPPAPGPTAGVAPPASTGARGEFARTGSAEEGRWESAIVYRLAERKRYPAKALRDGLSDTVMLRVTIDRAGRLLLAEIAKSRGIGLLDKEALALAERSSPYPAPPDSVVGDAVRLVVPIEFVVRERR